ncbi:uncharacterized protein H6S33_007104 [Morchella sextelata]|uniref:uncharacterized protein n=1 Tax=Morchella sextelata TaxID=1174677 RepID=UPI001D04706D|nr:uncharacterized protein H6S33_007104 [Morchella sextelata]KAH0604073.1 hypothetical protein H6S33_007104 [Morchella sextelata]
MLEIKLRLQSMNIEFDHIGRRLRFFGHVINIVVKAFLWEDTAEAFEEDIQSLQNRRKEEQELIGWRQKGPMGNLYNIITCIGCSPQRREPFEEKVKLSDPATNPLSLIQGNDTRWSGDYDSIVRAFKLRESIEDFVSATIRKNVEGAGEENIKALKWDELSTQDWDELRDIIDILGPFRKWQLILQGKTHNGALHDIFPAMDELLTHLEDTRTRYYDLTGPTPVHMSAIALHPEMKLDYFDGEWEDKPEWISNAHNSSRRLWETEYKHGYIRKKSSTPNIDEDDVSAAAAPTIIHDREVDELPISKRKKRARLAGSNQDEFELFQPRDCDEDLTLGPLQYWVQRNEPRQKQRERMGIEIHSIPAMSADPERLFSSSKLLISDRRNRLGDDIIEASECLKSWAAEGLVLSEEVSDISQMELMLRDLELQVTTTI